MNTTAEKLKPCQLFCITLMFNISSVLVFRGFIKSKTKFWICILMAGVVYNIFFALIIKLLKHREEYCVFSFIENLCGIKTGKIIGGLMCLYSVLVAIRVINSASSLVVNVSLDKTPQIIIITLIGLVSIYAIMSGLDVFGKFSVISFVLISIFLVLSFIIGFDNIEWSYAFAKTDLNIIDILSDISSCFAYPFGEGIILLCMLFETENQGKSRKTLSIASIISVSLLTLISLFCLSILGLPMLKTQYYTFYSTISVINFGELISRIEIIVSIILVLSLITKYAVCIFFSVSFIRRHFVKIKQNYIYWLLFILTSLVATFLGSRNYFLIKIFESYKLWVWVFQLIIPTVVGIYSFKKRKKL